MTLLTSKIQKLEPGARIILYEVDGSDFGADVLRFHSTNVAYTEAEIQAAIDAGEDLPAKSIYWQGVEYSPWPVQLTGVDINSDGTPSKPVLSVANLEGAITQLCLAYENLEKAKVSIHFTLGQFLDAENFSEGNDNADPTQEIVDVYYIEQKTSENFETIQFELSNPADVGSYKMGRKMTPYCQWCQRGQYRGTNCGYTGTAMFDEDDNSTEDAELDVCSGTITGCKLRFGEDAELPFGGFPAVRMIK